MWECAFQMKQKSTRWFVVVRIALVLSLIGCADSRVERLRVEPANPFQGPIRPLDGGADRVPLGQAMQAGPYSVRLTADAPPAEGPVRFTALITPSGKKMVSVSLSQPAGTSDGPTASLASTGEKGVYAGTVEIPSEGAWPAHVTVVGQSGTESAFFTKAPKGDEKALEGSQSAVSVQTGAPRSARCRIRPARGATAIPAQTAHDITVAVFIMRSAGSF